MRSPLAQFPIVCHSRKVYRKLEKLAWVVITEQVVAFSIVGNCFVSHRFVLARKQPGDPESLSLCRSFRPRAVSPGGRPYP